MALRLVGAGLGRTGTHSLKIALEQLLGGPCYHMVEVLGNPEAPAFWSEVARGERADFDVMLSGYAATVDWPTAAYYQELMAANPSAVVLLSSRLDPAAWWKSAHETIFAVTERGAPPDDVAVKPFIDMVSEMLTRRFTPGWRDPETAMAAYEAHNASVRASVPADRLVEWQPGDGWEPLCSALEVAVPCEPFPHVNSTAEFRAMSGLDAPPA